MYGLGKQPRTFEFDLEKQLKADPQKGPALLKQGEEKIQKLKNYLRQGVASDKEIDQCGSLLHAFTALQKVLQKATKKKK